MFYMMPFGPELWVCHFEPVWSFERLFVRTGWWRDSLNPQNLGHFCLASGIYMLFA